jgi:hypothetical protein
MECFTDPRIRVTIHGTNGIISVVARCDEFGCFRMPENISETTRYQWLLRNFVLPTASSGVGGDVKSHR